MNLADLFEANQALDGLFSKETDNGKLNYALGKVHRTLRSEMKLIDKERRRLQKKFGKESGSGEYEVPPERMNAYVEAVNDYLETETQTAFYAFDRSLLKGVKVKPKEESFLVILGCIPDAQNEGE